jgi:N-acetylmuramoyl-L-alanine amidase
MGQKTKSNTALIGVVILLCAALIGLGLLMGSGNVLAVDLAAQEPADASAPPVETKAPTPADEALAATEQVEREAMRMNLRSLQPVTRTIPVGLDVQNATATVECSFAPTYVDGVFGGYSYVVDGAAYFSIPDYCSMIDYPCTIDEQDAKTVRYTAAGAPMELTAGEETFTANGRNLKIESGVLALDGKLLLPLDTLQLLFGAEASYDAETSAVTVDTATKELIEDGESYYARQDIYWLSRIIYAEANGQPFDGMIGVGNVVLNRVNSARFPNTVEAVVFEPGQFTPVDNGSIYNEPSDDAILAAQMCLDGVNTVGNSLFFLNPSIADASWFNSSLSYVTTIGGHAFYA